MAIKRPNKDDTILENLGQQLQDTSTFPCFR